MDVVSFFDGMSGGNIALKELGYKVNYFASEIDPNAIKQTRLNFPDTEQLGDIVFLQRAITWKDETFNLYITSSWVSRKSKNRFSYLRNKFRTYRFDLVLAGSPCQGFSFAGKQLNFKDPRSKLFFVFVKLLNHIKTINPEVKFMLENVNMKKQYLRIISEHMGLFGVNINSNLVSAQNRNRWYWTNIRTKSVGLFGEIHADIPQPKDRGILLKDILQDESEINQKYYIKNPKNTIVDSFKRTDVSINPSKSHCLKSNEGRQRGSFIKLDKQLNKKADQNKAGCLTGSGHSGGNHSDMDIICTAMRGRNPDNSSDRKTGIPTKQRLEPKTDGKTNCLTSVSKDNLIMTKNYLQFDVSGKGYKSQQYRFFYPNGKHGSLPEARAESKNGLFDGVILRRLTPLEASRLQTIPDWYVWKCYDSQQYKMLGNGFTVSIISHILSFM